MTWTVPMTAVNGTVLTAAQWNLSVRDNILEMAAAKATQAGQIIVSSGAGQLAARTPYSAYASALENITGVSAGTNSGWLDLTTFGPSVTLMTGTTAFVFMGALISVSTVQGIGIVGYDITGASSIAASTDRGMNFRAGAVNQQFRAGIVDWRTDLTPGLNTFTLRYSVTASGSATNGTFGQRNIFVLPFS